MNALNKSMSVLLLAACSFVACGSSDDGDSKSLVGPTTEESEAPDTDGATFPPADEVQLDPEALVVFESLGATLTQAVGVMFQGGGTLDGELGSLIIEGQTIALDGYSPDGELILDGELTLNILAQPLTVKGAMSMSGSSTGEVVIDMTVASGDPTVYGGTVTVDGTPYDVAALAAQATPAG